MEKESSKERKSGRIGSFKELRYEGPSADKPKLEVDTKMISPAIDETTMDHKDRDYEERVNDSVEDILGSVHEAVQAE